MSKIKAKERKLPTRDYVMTKEEIAEELGISAWAVRRALESAAYKIRLKHPELADWVREDER